MPTTVDRRTEEDAARTMAAYSVAARYIQGIVLGILLITAFWPILVGMCGSWFDENAYMEHGILAAPAAAYMVWTKWSKLKQIPLQASAWGIPFLLIGALQATLGLA